MPSDDLRRRAAASLDADPVWWELLPALLRGLPGLGGDPLAVAELLEPLPAAARVLDLGCGSGGVAVELARRGYAVEGIDAHPGLVDEARERARAAGVERACAFEVGDVCERVRASAARYDAVLLIAIDPWEGDEARTARAVAPLLRAGGLVVRDWERSAALVPAWRAAGFELLREVSCDPGLVAAHEAELFARIEANARALVERDPSARAACAAYLDAQRAGGEREAATASATWVWARSTHRFPGSQRATSGDGADAGEALA